MIFKCKISHGDGWTYYDGIKSARVFTEEHDGKNCVMIDLTDSPHDGIHAVNTEAYLMNDNGKTLQVVHG